MVDSTSPPVSPASPSSSSSSTSIQETQSGFTFPAPSSSFSAAHCRGITTAQQLTRTSKRATPEQKVDEKRQRTAYSLPSTTKDDRWWITQRLNLYIIPPYTSPTPIKQLLSDEIDCLHFAGTAKESIVKGLNESTIYRMAMEVLKKHTTYPQAKANRKVMIERRGSLLSPDRHALAQNLIQYVYMVGCAHLHRANRNTALFTTCSGMNTVRHFFASKDYDGIVNVYHWSGQVTISEIPTDLRQGSGTFTLVQKVHNIATGCNEALKTCIPSGHDPNKVLFQLIQDIKRLRIVHEYAVNHGLPRRALPKLPSAVLGLISPHNVTAYVEELYEGGDLERLKYTTLSTDQALDLAAKLATILEALDIFHQAGVIHGDIKLANILFRFSPDGSFDLALTDVGLSFTHCELTSFSDNTEPELYSAEYRLKNDLENLQKYIKANRVKETLFLAHKMEVFAAGKTLDLVCKQAPLPLPVQQRLTAITQQMLDSNPAKRPTLAEARERWLASLAL